MGWWAIFLIATTVFIAVIYFVEQTEDETIGKATLSTFWMLCGLAVLFLVGGALWSLV